MGSVMQTTSGYCEKARAGWVKEPANTWSNLGFIIVGLTIAWQMMWGSFKKNANDLTRSDFLSIFFSSLVICLGPAAMAMHASYTRVGIELDGLSEYLVAGFILAYSTQRFFYMGTKYFLSIFFLVIVTCELLVRITIPLPIFRSLGNLVFASFLTLATVTEILIVFYRQSNIKKRWGIATLITVLTAFLIWSLSKNDGPLCYPRSLFQGHAAWHLLDALALYFLFLYYVSEHNSDQSQLIEESK
jgi:hypothetical protein